MNDSPRMLGNRYEIGDLLGRGGMAEVHLGRDSRLSRTVAVKLLRTDLARDPTFQARFRREAQSAASLNHPAIVSVYDTGEQVVTDAGGAAVPLPYIVMEYVQGQTLRELIESARARAAVGLPEGTTPPPPAGALDLDLALDVTGQVLAALDYSHRQGIVHRDIKPANVMVTPEGEAKVMDFGIARALADAQATMTQTQAVIGTAQYLSPEQARGETVDARSDLYSAGCLLYELLTGRPPFVADSPVAVAYQHVREFASPPSTFNPMIPEQVDRVVMHALAKDRELRYQTAAQFREDVEAARTGRAVAAPAGARVGDATAATELVDAPAATALLPGHVMEPTGPLDVVPGGQPLDQRYRPRENGRSSGVTVAVAVVGLLVVGLAAFLVTRFVSQRDDAPTTAAVPRVLTLTEADARTRLTTAGFTVGTSVQAPSETVEEGKVVDQDPPADSVQPLGATVTLTISSGSAKVEVPPVEGKSAEEASKALRDSKLQVGDVKTEDSAGKDPGTVIRTDPAAGTSVAPGTQVTLIIASGSVVVPDLVNKSLADATAELSRRNLGVYRVDEERSDVKPGTVVRQSPDKDTKVAPKTLVTLTVAVTPAPTDTPTPTPSSSGPTPSTSEGSGTPSGTPSP
ncbi:MAG: Stk1 family PASTA domain-containing Ser/Thr kinase [Kineosporiaceae bacterium]